MKKRLIIFQIFATLAALMFSPTESTAQDSFSRQKILLKKENARFSAVLSGKAISQPEETSYGFCLITDARMIQGISSSGKVLWEKQVQGTPEPYISVLSGDFILTVSSKRIVTLINPSGNEVWKKIVDFDITDKPVEGRDGRIFIRGKNNFCCLGMNGIQKWNVETPSQREIPPVEFNDGTLLLLLDETDGGKSKGLRISPFGEIIVTITFTGIINTAETSDYGILLTFEHGGLGLCAIDENSTINKWAIADESDPFSGTSTNQGTTLKVTSQNTACLLISKGSSTRIIFFQISTGKILSLFDAPDIDLKNKTFVSSIQGENGIFISDSENAVIYNSSGKLLYSVQLPPNPGQKNWNYICYSSSNYLLICEKSWLMMGWRTIQKVTGKKSRQNRKNYDNFYEIHPEFYTDESGSLNRIQVQYADPARTHLLLEGDYGMQEQFWTSILLSAYSAYLDFSIKIAARGTRIEQNLFQRDREGTEILLNQLSLTGTDLFSKNISRLINYEEDKHQISLMLRAIKNFGYDPDSQMLNTLDKLLMRLPAGCSMQLSELCDAVYEIVRFMGRPAFSSHGKEMLIKLQYPQYDNIVRAKARETLIKISNLKDN